jgi:ankyrin repeat protein
VNINSRDPFSGFTALIAASFNGRFHAVEFLLEKGADVNAKTKTGVTALMAASLDEANKAVAELLLDKGAEINAQTASGKTALQFSGFADEVLTPMAFGTAKGASEPLFQNEMTKLLKDRGAK